MHDPVPLHTKVPVLGSGIRDDFIPDHDSRIPDLVSILHTKFKIILLEAV
jgi:hypothetical protein